MENAPLTVDDDSETDYLSKKKDTKKYGFMALERQSDDEGKKEKSFFSKLAEQEEAKKLEKAAEKEKELIVETEKTLEPKISVPETEPATELQAPLERPSTTETAEVIQPKLVEVIEELEADKEPDPISDPPVNKFRELVKTGEDPEQALNEVLTDLGAEDEIEDRAESVTAESSVDESESEIKVEEVPETVDPGIQDFEEDDMMVDLSDESVPEASAESTSESSSTPESTDDSDDEDNLTPSSTTPPNNGSNIPPQPPFGTLPNSLNTPPVIPIDLKETKQHQPEYNQASPAAMALFGGIIGYLIGRRRGRIKTEKKLLPIQKKLEKEVENLQFNLQEKEKKIRKVAAEKVQQVGPSVIEAFKVAPAMAEIDSHEDRQKAPEAQLLHAPKKTSEHIGKVIVTAESKPIEKSLAMSPEMIIPHLSEQKVHTLSRQELLEISSKINVGDSSLRKIFDTNLVGEKGLRRLIAVYMTGGDLAKALQNEIVEHEIDFERDPAMRDIAATSDPIQGNSSTALNELLEKAKEKVSGDDPEQAYYKETKSVDEKSKSSSSASNPKLLDYIFITIIIILSLVVFYLVFFR